MSWIIERTNGTVTQFWGSNRASWAFFRNGMSRDIEWSLNETSLHQPWLFKSEKEAQWYLNKRKESLTARAYREDSKWTYTIREVEE